MDHETTAAKTRLGNPVNHYQLSHSRLREIVLLMMISATVASCFFLTAIFTNDSSVSGLVTRIGITLPGLLFTLPVVVGIRQLVRLRGNSLSLYENGLIFRSHGKETITTWEEIDSYIQESACRITKKDGEVIEFGLSIEGADEVADEIQERTLQAMLPKVKATILGGGSVQFKGLMPFEGKALGKRLNDFTYAFSGFSVDLQGITAIDSGKSMAWKDVTDYGIDHKKMGRTMVDVFFLQAGDTRFWTRYGLLSNAHVLLALCDEMTGLQGENKS